MHRRRCLTPRGTPGSSPSPMASALTARPTPLLPPEVVRLRPGGEPAPWTALHAGRADPGRVAAIAAGYGGSLTHGQQDRCVPLGQAQELYAGLREFGVPAEFVSYPREGHQAREPAHVADQRERVLRFLASHLEVP
jgi:predicted esterase